ncbi:MAG: GntR family transcriptional regulator [Lentisphaeria bacterium]|nr:GntR family transcriptional regulator [Lentisphaeria bacterium]
MPNEQISEYIQQAYNAWLVLLQDNDERAFSSDAQLANVFEVSRFSVQRAKALLVERGLLTTAGHKKISGRKVLKKDFFAEPESAEKKSTLLVKSFLLDLGRGVYRADQPINESELAKKYDCNVALIREVMLNVQGYSLVEKKGRSQWRVLPIDTESAREVTEFREAVELFTLKQMLERSQDDPVRVKFESLLVTHEIMYAKQEKFSIDDFMELDKEFHHSLIDACDNRFFDRYKMLISFFIYNTLRVREIEGNTFSGLLHHIEVLRFVRENKASQAIKSMRKHILFSGMVLTELSDLVNHRNL